MVVADCRPNGRSIELGSGTGGFKELHPDLIASDVTFADWLDLCFDGHEMPFRDSSVANVILFDVLHHLQNPLFFFKEAERVLMKSGRILIIEPYPSPFSLIAYRMFHPEPFNFKVDYFNQIKVRGKKDPWEANQAIAHCLFFKNRERFIRYFDGKLKIIRKTRFACLLYPLSGGFDHPSYVPNSLVPFLRSAERFLSPLASLLAFRCYVVLEKT